MNRNTGPEPLLGAHMSIAGGTPKAVERALRVGCRALQIFVKNNNQWKGKLHSEDEVREFRQAVRHSGLRAVVAHNSYLINLAAPGKDLWTKSVEAMTDELSRCRRLGLSHLVIHPGSHVGSGEAAGIKRISEALDELHRRPEARGVRITLETTAGQGNHLGFQFEQLRDILAGCRSPRRLAICMDTCHVFAAGYDLRDEESYARTMEAFERTIGLKKLELFHFNDSRRELGSRVDRHEHIGKGAIGKSGFARILNDPRFASVPKILETPKGDDLAEDRRNLHLLRSLVRS